jgi:hypothetical protein
VMNAQKPKKRRVKDPVCSYLKKLISPYGFGWEGEDGGVGRYTNEQLIRFYNSSGFMGTPSNSDLYSHFAGQITLYFWADGRKSSPQTNSLIDIDCHKRGNPQSAKAFADWLSDNYLPNLFNEPSTHGTGRHGYFVLFKDGFKDIAVANILKRLDKTLKKLLELFLATHPEHEIENVEIKGTPHIITWAKGAKRQIETMKSGALAKVPRDILDRFEEFKNTTVLSFNDIENLEAQVDQIVIPAPKNLSIVKAKGSTSSHPIVKDEIEAITGPYLEFAKSWIPEPIGTSSRAMVEAGDLAIALPIVKFCSKERNADGTMPTSRIKVIWDRLFESGEVDRAFDYHRWRVIRDLIETQGGLAIEDRHYYTGFVNDRGHEIRGVAAKWKMADWLVSKLEKFVEFGYQLDAQQTASSEALIADCDHKVQSDQGNLVLSSPIQWGERALLEQIDDQDDDSPFDTDWIIEFRQTMPQLIGLIWGGSIQNIRREAG